MLIGRLGPVAWAVVLGGIAGTVLAVMGVDSAVGAAAVPERSNGPAIQTTARGAAPASPFVRPDPLDYGDHAGWTSLFDGRTLGGWDGNPEVWNVEDGNITAVSTPEERGTTRRELAWRGGVVLAEPGKNPRLVGTVGDGEALKKGMRSGDLAS